jgi:hypothetical protein
MAEPPSPLTDTLRAERYEEFVRLVRTQGLVRECKPDVLHVIAELHRELRAMRHPPGPTVEYLVIERLVQRGILDARALQLGE